MIIGIIIGILIWQLVSFITYMIFDNESYNIVSGGVFAIIALVGCGVIKGIKNKVRKGGAE